MLFFKIWKISCTNPPLCKKIFFDMPFLMSHGGVFHRGSKLANFEKVYHTVCVLQRLCLLRVFLDSSLDGISFDNKVVEGTKIDQRVLEVDQKAKAGSF